MVFEGHCTNIYDTEFVLTALAWTLQMNNWIDRNSDDMVSQSEWWLSYYDRHKFKVYSAGSETMSNN